MKKQIDKMEIGKMENIRLREVWPNERDDFTPWLADESLELVTEAIGIELALEGREYSVGPYSADILCKNTNSTSDTPLVVIENQYDTSNHDHLGKLLTYAGNLETATIVWISERFTKEHKAALNWLNKNTSQDIDFFGLEIKLLKIGDSLPAPLLNVVASPENWKKSRPDPTKTGKRKRTDLEKFQKQYWDHFQKYAKNTMNKELGLSLQPPQYSNVQVIWTGLGMEFYIASRIKNKTISVEFSIEWNRNASKELNIKNSSEILNILKKSRKEIEGEIGCDEDCVEWKNRSGTKTSKIILHKNAYPNNKKDWGIQHKWIKEKVECFARTFKERVSKIDFSQLSTNEEEN